MGLFSLGLFCRRVAAKLIKSLWATGHWHDLDTDHAKILRSYTIVVRFHEKIANINTGQRSLEKWCDLSSKGCVEIYTDSSKLNGAVGRGIFGIGWNSLVFQAEVMAIQATTKISGDEKSSSGTTPYFLIARRLSGLYIRAWWTPRRCTVVADVSLR